MRTREPLELPPHSGASVILFDNAGRVLLQQRDDDVPPAGYGRWTIPGGKREGAETPAETALREFEEETGIRLQRMRFWVAATRAEYPGLLAECLHLFFADDPVDPASVQVNEGLDMRFWSPVEIRALPMNPQPRALLERFFASDHYRGTLAVNAPERHGVAVLALDRWGRVLLQLRDADLPPERSPNTWSLPGGMIEPGEAPDAAGLREFEEETGVLLEHLQFYRLFRPADIPSLPVNSQHVYYIDADIEEGVIEVREGQAFAYIHPDDLPGLDTPTHAREILGAFFGSPAYRGMFH